MSVKQFSDSTLLELVDVEDSEGLVDWNEEWKKLLDRYRKLEGEFATLVSPTDERPIDIFKVVRELAELSGGSVCFNVWHKASVNELEFYFYSAINTTHYHGNTFADAEKNFRAAFAKEELL